jgi:hypothetical protein
MALFRRKTAALCRRQLRARRHFAAILRAAPNRYRGAGIKKPGVAAGLVREVFKRPQAD